MRRREGVSEGARERERDRECALRPVDGQGGRSTAEACEPLADEQHF